MYDVWTGTDDGFEELSYLILLVIIIRIVYPDLEEKSLQINNSFSK